MDLALDEYEEVIDNDETPDALFRCEIQKSRLYKSKSTNQLDVIVMFSGKPPGE